MHVGLYVSARFCCGAFPSHHVPGDLALPITSPAGCLAGRDERLRPLDNAAGQADGMGALLELLLHLSGQETAQTFSRLAFPHRWLPLR